MNNTKKIFITGGGGFIGSNLVRFLLERKDYKVTIYDNFSQCPKQNVESAIKDSGSDKASIIQSDILDAGELEKSIEGHDVVVHLAAHTRVVESLESPRDNFTVNCAGTFNALEAARRNGVTKFIFASSNAALGEQVPPVHEGMVPRPLSPYGASKLYGEALCSAYFHSYGLQTVSLRFSNAYGPYSQHKTSVISKFIKRAKNGKQLHIYGDGEQTRDFIYAEDVCNAIYLSIAYVEGEKNRGGEVFQIATSVDTTIAHLAELVCILAKHSGYDEPDILNEDTRQGEIRANYADTDKARKTLGFVAKKSLKQGLEETWKALERKD